MHHDIIFIDMKLKQITEQVLREQDAEKRRRLQKISKSAVECTNKLKEWMKAHGYTID